MLLDLGVFLVTVTKKAASVPSVLMLQASVAAGLALGALGVIPAFLVTGDSLGKAANHVTLAIALADFVTLILGVAFAQPTQRVIDARGVHLALGITMHHKDASLAIVLELGL